MINDRKRTPKKHVGPAMQWARRDRPVRWRARERPEIKVDFDIPNQAQDSSENPENSQQVGYGPHAVGRGENKLTSNEPERNSSGWAEAADNPSHHRPHLAADERNAWDFYSRSSEATTQNDQRGANERRSTYGEDDYYQIDDDPYFGDLSELRGTQLNRATWSQDPNAHGGSDKTTWPQYALAILVVALLISLAVITLFL